MCLGAKGWRLIHGIHLIQRIHEFLVRESFHLHVQAQLMFPPHAVCCTSFFLCTPFCSLYLCMCMHADGTFLP